MVRAGEYARPSAIVRRLQWSHVFSDMVRNEAPLLEIPWSELLQWSHVFSDMVRMVRGAAAGDENTASMEPCLFRHGKSVGARFDRPGILPLQWSHVFSDMVSLRVPLVGEECRVCFNGAMSFQTW